MALLLLIKLVKRRENESSKQEIPLKKPTMQNSPCRSLVLKPASALVSSVGDL